MLKNYVKVSFRYLIKHKAFTFINVFGLTFGLICFIFMTVWVWDECSVDRFHEDSARLYQLFAEKDQSGESIIVPYAPSSLVQSIADEVPEVNSIARLFPAAAVFEKGASVFSEKGIYADSSLLDIFSFPLKEGSRQNIFSDPNSVVLSAQMAEKYFPGQWALGQYIYILQNNNKQPHVVTGILEKIPAQSSIQFDFILPYQPFEDAYRPWWKDSNKYSFSNYNVSVFIKTAPESDRRDINDKLTTVLKNHSVAGHDDALFVYPFVDVYLHDDFSGGRNPTDKIQYVKLISVVAVIVLLIACINFINLYTVMASKRHKEVGLRKAVGAQRKQVIYQFLIEASLIAFTSMFLAITLVEVLLPFFNILTQKHIVLLYSSPLFLLILTGGSLLIGVLAGGYPAILFSSFSLLPSKRKLNIAGGLTGLRKGLVIFQFTLSIAFIVFTIVVFDQIQFIHNSDLGIRKDNILRHELHNIRGRQEDYKNALLRLPGVQSVSFTEQHPLNTSNKNNGVQWSGKPEEGTFFFNVIQADEDFIRTFEIDLKEGRPFTDINSVGEHTPRQIILNEEAVKIMNLSDPVGTELTVWGQQGIVVGIVKNYHHQALTQAIEPVVILCNLQETWSAYISIDPTQINQTIQDIHVTYQKYENQHPFDFSFIESDYNDAYANLQTVGRLSSLFAGAAILISCLGLFGLSAFLMQQRSKETGIRKVLGAQVISLLILFSKDFMKLVLIAIAIALPLAWFYVRWWLSNYAYHFELGLTPFVVAGFIAVIIAMGSVIFNTLKASMINPAVTLKEE